MKPATLLLIVLERFSVPFYFAYCEYLSGQTAETHTLTTRRSLEPPDGAILRFRGGRGYLPVTPSRGPY